MRLKAIAARRSSHNILLEATYQPQGSSRDSHCIDSTDPKKLIGLKAFDLDRILDDLDPTFLSADDGGNDDAKTDPNHAHGHGHGHAATGAASTAATKDHGHGHGHATAAAAAAAAATGTAATEKHGHGHDHTGEGCTHPSHARVANVRRRKQLHDMKVTSVGFTVDKPLNLGQLQQWISFLMQSEGKNVSVRVVVTCLTTSYGTWTRGWRKACFLSSCFVLFCLVLSCFALTFAVVFQSFTATKE